MDEGRHGQITKLVQETVIMLCKNGVCYERQLRVQGLIGVTVDDGTVFLVHVNESVDADGYSSDNPGNNQHSGEVSTSNHQSSADSATEQCQVEEYQWSKTLDVSASQYSCVKQEREPSGTVNDPCAASQNAADVPAAATTSLLPVQQTKFVDHDDVICIESASSQSSVGNNCLKHEPSGIWNPYSVTSAANQHEYGWLDYSASQLSSTSVNRAPIRGDTSQHSESHGNETGYGDMGATHYISASRSQKLLHSSSSQLARMGRGLHKMVPHSVPRPSWHITQIPDALPQPPFAVSLQPTTLQHMAVNMQPRPKKRGRSPKIMQTTQRPATAEFESSMDVNNYEWEVVKLTKFSCKLCGQTFNHKPNLFRHQITVHGRQKKTCCRRGRSST